MPSALVWEARVSIKSVCAKFPFSSFILNAQFDSECGASWIIQIALPLVYPVQCEWKAFYLMCWHSGSGEVFETKSAVYIFLRKNATRNCQTPAFVFHTTKKNTLFDLNFLQRVSSWVAYNIFYLFDFKLSGFPWKMSYECYFFFLDQTFRDKKWIHPISEEFQIKLNESVESHRGKKNSFLALVLLMTIWHSKWKTNVCVCWIRRKMTILFVDEMQSIYLEWAG